MGPLAEWHGGTAPGCIEANERGGEGMGPLAEWHGGTAPGCIEAKRAQHHYAILHAALYNTAIIKERTMSRPNPGNPISSARLHRGAFPRCALWLLAALWLHPGGGYCDDFIAPADMWGGTLQSMPALLWGYPSLESKIRYPGVYAAPLRRSVTAGSSANGNSSSALSDLYVATELPLFALPSGFSIGGVNYGQDQESSENSRQANGEVGWWMQPRGLVKGVSVFGWGSLRQDADSTSSSNSWIDAEAYGRDSLSVVQAEGVARVTIALPNRRSVLVGGLSIAQCRNENQADYRVKYGWRKWIAADSLDDRDSVLVDTSIAVPYAHFVKRRINGVGGMLAWVLAAPDQERILKVFARQVRAGIDSHMVTDEVIDQNDRSYEYEPFIPKMSTGDNLVWSKSHSIDTVTGGVGIYNMRRIDFAPWGVMAGLDGVVEVSVFGNVDEQLNISDWRRLRAENTNTNVRLEIPLVLFWQSDIITCFVSWRPHYRSISRWEINSRQRERYARRYVNLTHGAAGISATLNDRVRFSAIPQLYDKVVLVQAECSVALKGIRE